MCFLRLGRRALRKNQAILRMWIVWSLDPKMIKPEPIKKNSLVRPLSAQTNEPNHAGTQQDNYRGINSGAGFCRRIFTIFR